MDYEDRVQGVGTDFVQLLTTSNTLTTGSFTLNFQGQSAGPFTYNDNSVSVIQPALNAAWGEAVTVTGDTVNYLRFVFYNIHNKPPAITVSANTTGQTFSLAESISAQGNGYTGEFQTPHLDFSWADQKFSSVQKHFDHLAVHYIPESSGNLSCDYFIDGRYVETITFPMVQYEQPELDTLVLSTDRLAQGNHETAILGLSGSGRTISFRFYNSGYNESFQIPAITVGFRPGGHGAQKV